MRREFVKTLLLVLILAGLVSCTKSASLLMSDAVRNGRVDEVKKLLGDDAFAKNPKNVNNFFRTCPANDDLLKLFIVAGAEVNYIDRAHGSVLSKFADEDVKTLQLLIDSGADVNDMRSGRAALFTVTKEGNLKFFIKNGANLALQDDKGNTPLHHAVSKNRLEIVKVLLEAGVDTTIKNKRNKVAGEIAKRTGTKKLIAYLKKKGAIPRPPLRNVKNLKHQVALSYHAESQYSPDGKFFVLAARDIILFDAKSRKQLSVLSQKGAAVAIEFSADSQNLAVLYKINSGPIEKPFYELVNFELPTLKESKRFRLPTNSEMKYPEIKISPDKKLVATNFASKIVVFDWNGKVSWEWQVDEKKNLNRQRGRFDVTPDWKYFLINLQRVQYPSKATLPAIKFNDRSRPLIHDAKISADGKKAVASGESNGEVFRLFDLEAGTLIKEKKVGFTKQVLGNSDLSVIVGEHGIWYPAKDQVDSINPVSNSDGLDALAYCVAKGEVSAGSLYFSLNTAKKWKSVDPNKGDGLWFGFASHGIIDTYRFAGTANKISTRGVGYDMQTKDVDSVPYKGFSAGIKSPDGSFEIIRHTKMIKFKNGEQLLFLPESLQKEHIQNFEISQNNIISCATRNGTIITYDVAARKLKLITVPDQNGFHDYNAKVSPGGSFIEVRDWTGSNKISIYDFKSEKVLFDETLTKTSTRLFTLDEKYYVVTNQKNIYFYNTKNWKVEKTITLSSGGVITMDISPDNKTLLVSNTNAQGQLWDIESGLLVSTLVRAASSEIIVFDSKGIEMFSTDKVADLFK